MNIDIELLGITRYFSVTLDDKSYTATEMYEENTDSYSYEIVHVDTNESIEDNNIKDKIIEVIEEWDLRNKNNN